MALLLRTRLIRASVKKEYKRKGQIQGSNPSSFGYSYLGWVLLEQVVRSGVEQSALAVTHPKIDQEPGPRVRAARKLPVLPCAVAAIGRRIRSSERRGHRNNSHEASWQVRRCLTPRRRWMRLCWAWARTASTLIAAGRLKEKGRSR